MYDETVPYDKNTTDNGLLKGGFILKVYIHIFNGRSIAMVGLSAPKTRPSKGDLMNMSSATPETIAYAACMAYAFIFKGKPVSTCWTIRCKYVSLKVLYRAILALFEDERWGMETIAFYNS